MGVPGQAPGNPQDPAGRLGRREARRQGVPAPAELERYGDIQRVQRALNHSSIETTLIYAMADKLLDAKLKQAKRRKRPA